MDRPVDLIALNCVKCSRPVPAQPDEVAWVCRNCGQGLLLDDEKGLAALTVQYAAGIAPNTSGKPFWVTTGEVSLDRQTYSGNNTQDAQKFWGSPHRFFIPAFTCPLETLLGTGTNLLQNPPALQEGPVSAFEPVTLSVKDVQPLAEFIVVALEAGRKDKVKEIRFKLTLTAPALWVLP